MRAPVDAGDRPEALQLMAKERRRPLFRRRKVSPRAAHATRATTRNEIGAKSVPN
jgi:hypothetical protein